MIRPRGPYVAAISKASPQTLCQKCLKRDSYECKASAQERPYMTRPSRSQQLSNPKLLPKLTDVVPNDLPRKEGIADEVLANKEKERNRQRSLDGGFEHSIGKRSASTSSFSSVSTISTNKSRSVSPRIARVETTGASQLMEGLEMNRKRRRSLSSTASRSSGGRYDRKESQDPRSRRGYRQGQHVSARSLDRSDSHAPYRRSGHTRRSPSSSYSYGSDTSLERTRDIHRKEGGKRRRRASKSPERRGREKTLKAGRSSRKTHSPSHSKDRSTVARQRKSMTPAQTSRAHDVPVPRTEIQQSFARRGSFEAQQNRYGGNRRHDEDQAGHAHRQSQRRRERSLSPFSKRLALTQAMNNR